jgi:hypothetical protein
MGADVRNATAPGEFSGRISFSSLFRKEEKLVTEPSK